MNTPPAGGVDEKTLSQAFKDSDLYDYGVTVIGVDEDDKQFLLAGAHHDEYALKIISTHLGYLQGDETKPVAINPAKAKVTRRMARFHNHAPDCEWQAAVLAGRTAEQCDKLVDKCTCDDLAWWLAWADGDDLGWHVTLVVLS